MSEVRRNSKTYGSKGDISGVADRKRKIPDVSRGMERRFSLKHSDTNLRHQQGMGRWGGDRNELQWGVGWRRLSAPGTRLAGTSTNLKIINGGVKA